VERGEGVSEHPSNHGMAGDGDGAAPVARQPLNERVARELRAAILAGRLVPGERIRQERVAHDFGTSRIPVREALRQLENEGLVTLEPHVGARVARLDLAEHIELYRMRELVEPMVLGESVPRLEEERIDQLEALVEEIAAERDQGILVELDRRFHLGCFEGAEMPRALRLIEGFWNATQQYRRVFYGFMSERYLDLINADHRLMIDSIRRRDAAEASERLHLHIRRTRVTLVDHAELFDDAPKENT
jgi:DNA-binding GntR family transcriptional regulator